MSMSSGVPVLLTSAQNADAALAGEEVGTWFEATASRLPARQLWLAYAADIRGQILVDEGAARAVVRLSRVGAPGGSSTSRSA